MAETKTRPTDVAVEEFIAATGDPRKIAESRQLIALMQQVTGEPPRLWGPSIVGFGTYHYRYESGHEGDSCLVGFSPRKAEFSIYLNGSFFPQAIEQRDALLGRLGKHRMGKGCLYVKRLGDVDMDVLEALVRLSVESLETRYGRTK